MKQLVIGDVHGSYRQLKKLLEVVPKDLDLVFVGDLIDRGPEPEKVVRLVDKLVSEGKASLILGNHEDLFMEYVKNPLAFGNLYLEQGGRRTIEDFVPAFKTSDNRSINRYLTMNLGRFEVLKSLCKKAKLFIETESFIITHAGIDFNKENWREDNQDTFCWIREEFYEEGVNNTGKTVIFGHTPTHHLNSDGSNLVWTKPEQKLIGIDGGAVFKGLLHGVVIDDKSPSKLDCFSVESNLNVTECTIML